MHNKSNIEDSGRHIIFYHPEALPEVARNVHNKSGISMPSRQEVAEDILASDEWRKADTLVLPNLGVIVSSAPLEQISRLEFGVRTAIRQVREEYIFQITAPPLESDSFDISADYLIGYQEGVNALVSRLLERSALEIESSIQDTLSFADNAALTWGLQATSVDQSQFTGKGVRISILDTGFDVNHSDFSSRSAEIVSKSFISEIATAKDDNGHGTHCLGTLAGPEMPSQGRRYGIAFDAELFVGKVMKSDGFGNERDILQGIEWAIQNNCRVISMSIGKPVNVGDEPDKDYEVIGSIALSHNCLIIAAAGNSSERPGQVAPVEIPANSKTIMAVGAINRRLGLFPDSNGGVNLNGGGVDIVAPGVDVYSSKLTPPIPRYGLANGTSMATPHVAGIAALMMEANPTATAEQIWTRLTQSAKRLPLPSTDVGSGLVQAI